MTQAEPSISEIRGSESSYLQKMAAAIEVENGENLCENSKSEEEAQSASSISCTEKATSCCEIQSPEIAAVKKKKFYAKKPRTAELIQMLHVKWLRQWIAGNGLNPIMLINQIMPSAEYSLLSSENVSNQWHFVIQLKFNDQIYQGKGSSKKKAKSEAAEKAVRALAAACLGSLAERVAANGALMAPVDGPGSDPCSSNPVLNFVASDSEMQQNGLNSEAPQVASTTASALKPQADEVTSRIATRILNEVRPGTKYEVVSAKEKHLTDMYTIGVTVDGQRFEATGPSKQKAKAAVAELVLTGLFNLKFNKLTDGTPVFAGNAEDWMSLRVGQLDSKLLDGLDFLGAKSPLMWLNELYPLASFDFSNVESVVVDAHTLYEVSVSVESQKYEGRGRSKKQAKLAAALAALRDLNATGKFAQRVAEKEKLKKHRIQPWHNEGRPRTFPPYFARQPLGLASGLPRNVSVKDPISRLREIHPDLNYEFIQSDSDHNFAVSVIVQGHHEVGSGPTKMHAVNSAAEKALQNLGLWTAYDEQAKKEQLHQHRSAGKTHADFHPAVNVLKSVTGNFDPLGNGRGERSVQSYRVKFGGSSGVFNRHGGPSLLMLQGDDSMGENGICVSGPRSRGYRGQFRRFNVQRFGSGARGAFVQRMPQSNPVVKHVPPNTGRGVIPNANGLDVMAGYHF